MLIIHVVASSPSFAQEGSECRVYGKICANLARRFSKKESQVVFGRTRFEPGIRRKIISHVSVVCEMSENPANLGRQRRAIFFMDGTMEQEVLEIHASVVVTTNTQSQIWAGSAKFGGAIIEEQDVGTTLRFQTNGSFITNPSVEIPLHASVGLSSPLSFGP